MGVEQNRGGCLHPVGAKKMATCGAVERTRGNGPTGLSLALLFLAVAPSTLCPQPTGDTLQSLLQKATEAFRTGAYAEASDFFNGLEREFGDEAEYEDAELQAVILPIRGYAELMAGHAGRAGASFNEFLRAFPDDFRRRPFVLFSLAQALRASGEIAGAASTYEQFENEFPDTGEAPLARLKRVELHFTLGENDRGFELLDGLYHSGAPFSLRVQGRLRALQRALEIERFDVSVGILSTTDWAISRMPELAVLAFSAMRVGDHLMATGRYQDAIRAYRLVPPQTQLVAAQEARLNEIKRSYANRKSTITESAGAFWAEYYRQLIQRVEKQLANLKSSRDYTAPFLLRLGQAFVLGERPREAWLVYERLAEDVSLDRALREEAHYRWILAANVNQRWSRVRSIADDFLNSYPNSPLAANARFLVAQALQEERDYGGAVAILTDLVDNYPDRDLAHRWLFTRGFCFLLDAAYPAARADFRRYGERWPNGALQVNARLWHALSWFFQRDYTNALGELDRMLTEVTDHHLVPEIYYRRASTLYASRRHDAALAEIDEFLARYPGHARGAEARVLRGDILMGTGELLGAAVAFSQVTPEAGNLFTYAVFQTGKIYRAMEDYERMASFFEHYARRDDLERKERLSEALYWIGWAYVRMNQPETAFPIFLDVLKTHGDRPEASEITSVLAALHQLYVRYQKGGTGRPIGGHRLFSHPDFKSWLEASRAEALGRKALTYYARISLYQASLLEGTQRTDEAQATLLQIVEKIPIEYLDAEALGRTGLVLEELEFPSARRYLNALLDRYPESSQRAMAFVGLARQHFREGSFAKVLPWLERFSTETPVHPLSAEAALLHGRALIGLGDAAAAISTFEQLLRLKAARGRPHAEAMMGVAEAYRMLNEPGKAIAYNQRVYTLYRAYHDLVITAYYQSARLFEDRGDLPAAAATLAELLGNDDLRRFPNYNRAEGDLSRIQSLIAPTIQDEAATHTPTP